MSSTLRLIKIDWPVEIMCTFLTACRDPWFTWRWMVRTAFKFSWNTIHAYCCIQSVGCMKYCVLINEKRFFRGDLTQGILSGGILPVMDFVRGTLIRGTFVRVHEFCVRRSTWYILQMSCQTVPVIVVLIITKFSRKCIHIKRFTYLHTCITLKMHICRDP